MISHFALASGGTLSRASWLALLSSKLPESAFVEPSIVESCMYANQ